MNKLHVCTPCVYPNTDPIKLLVRSGERVGIKVHPYGLGGKWVSFYTVKLPPLREYIKGVKEPYILILDGTDTLIMQNEEKIVEAIDFYKGKVVAEANIVLYPWEANPDDYPETPNHYRYLCSGMIAGPTQKVEELVTEICTRPPVDGWHDQTEWMKLYAEGRMKIDYECRLCQDMTDGAGDTKLTDKGMFNTLTNTYPCTAHWGGHVGGREFWWNAIQRNTVD